MRRARLPPAAAAAALRLRDVYGGLFSGFAWVWRRSDRSFEPLRRAMKLLT